MVYYSQCSIPTNSGNQIIAQCEVSFGKVTMEEKWLWIAILFTSVARPLVVVLITTVIWHLWWWSRYTSYKIQNHHGSSWAIGTSMTHMLGFSMVWRSIRRIFKYGIRKVTVAVTFLTILTGILVPSLSIYWASLRTEVGKVPYIYEQSKTVNSTLTASIANRSNLITTFGEISYKEKPLLSFDIFAEVPSEMSTVAILPPHKVSSWWNVAISPKKTSCSIYSAEVLKENSNAKFSASFGDADSDVVAEFAIRRCSTIKPSIAFLKDKTNISNDSVLAFSNANLLANSTNQSDWCLLSYSCGVDINIMFGDIYTDGNKTLNWKIYSASSSSTSLKQLMSDFQESVGLDNSTMNLWLEDTNDWKSKAIHALKEAASIKYDMYSMLGKSQSPDAILARTINEFTREAIVKNFGSMTVKVSGTTRKMQISWFYSLLWLVISALMVAVLIYSFSKSKKHKLVQEMIGSWNIMNQFTSIKN